MKMMLSAAAALAVATLTSPSFAQSSMPSTPGGQGGMGHMAGMPMPKGASPASDDLMMAMHRMDETMMAVDDPNPDRAWAKKMIAHHEGAIAMSEIELRRGGDREAQRMARKTIAEQRKSIAEIRSWLSRH